MPAVTPPAQLFTGEVERPASGRARTLAVGWPVWRFQAQVELVARRPHDELDVFEAAILELAAAGGDGAGAVADDLGLDRRLVRRIWRSLEQSGYLRNGAPTPEGRERLDRLTRLETQIVSGWALVDAVTARPWPRFPRLLQPVEQADERGGERELRVRLEGDDRDRPVYLIPAAVEAVAPPDAATLRRIVRDAEAAGRSRVAAAIGRGLPDGIARVLDGTPTLTWMLTWIYRDRNRFEDGTETLDATVRVSDPCVPGDAQYLKEALDGLRATDRGFDLRLRRRFEQGREDELRLRAAAQEIDRRRTEALARLSPPIPAGHPVLAVLAETLAMRALGREDRGLAELAAAMETVLRHVSTDEQREAAFSRLRGRAELEPMIGRALAACGFAPAVPDGVVTALVHAEHRRGSLRAIAALTALIAADDDAHPLRRLAGADAEAERADGQPPLRTAWLADLDTLGALRNVRAHGHGPEGPARRMPGPATTDRLYRMVELSATILLSTEQP